MAATLRNQPVASTNLDLQGEQISEEDLTQIFESMPLERPLYENHDVSRAPVGRVYNNRLERLGDGSLAIVCDIDVYDESQLEKWRGFSISFNRGTRTPELGDDCQFGVSFNPGQIPRDELEPALSDFGRDRVALLERGDKSLFAAGIAIYIMCKGFFDEAGADVYRLWKAMLLTALRRDPDARVAVHSAKSDRWPEMLLIPAATLEPDDLVPIDYAGIVEQARELAPGNEIVKVVLKVSDGGFAYLDHAVDRHGVAVLPPAEALRLDGEPSLELEAPEDHE